MREYLKELRTSKGLSMQEAADGLGISRQYYCFIENGTRQRIMDITLAERIAEFFGLDLSEVNESEKQWRSDADSMENAE